MNVLDENVSDEQCQILRGWRIPFRQIGYGLGRKEMQDDEIIPFLLTFSRPTFFTLDADFYKQRLCHAGYGLVYRAVTDFDTATFVRRVLRHPQFDTEAKRMGVVMRVSLADISVWRLHAAREAHVAWSV